jgi:hypothetical protein
MFNVGQRAAVASAFRLAGYDGPLYTAPVTSGDERFFVLPADAFRTLHGVRDLTQVLTQLLRLKVAVLEQTAQWPQLVPFE